MEPQRGWQFPASSRPHTSQPAEGLRQQWSLSNGGAINLSGLLETRSEEIGHGSASMSLILRRDGNTSGGQGRTVVLSPSVGSEGTRQSPAAERRARTDVFGAGMPPERPSSSHQLRSEHANGHSQHSTMSAYRDSSLWPQQHLARTDWDAMWQSGGSVPLDAYGQPQPGRLSAMQQQKDAQRAGASQQLPTSFPMSSGLQQRPQSRMSPMLPSSAPLEQRLQWQAERAEALAHQLPSSSAGHGPVFSGFLQAAEAPEDGAAQRHPNGGFSFQNQQAHSMQALPPARPTQSSMGYCTAQQTHPLLPEFHAFQSGQQHFRRPPSSSVGTPQRDGTPQQKAASYSQWQPSAGGRGTPDPPPAGATYSVGMSHPQQPGNGQWQPRTGATNQQRQQHVRAAFPGISAGRGDASYIQRLEESPQQWQRSVQASHQSLQRQQLLQAQLRLRAESQASAAMEQQQQQHSARGLHLPPESGSRSPQLPPVPQPGSLQSQRDSAPHGQAQEQHTQRRSGPSDSRLALQAAVLSKRMGQEPVPMPAEKGSGRLPEVTLFLRQLRQHWESRGSDVAANKWTHPSLPGDRGQSYPLDLAALYQAVAERGGYEKVTRRKWWRSLGCDCLGADPERNRLNNEVKLAYETYLKSFADRYFDAGKVPEAESDRLGRESFNKFPTNNLGKRLDVPASRLQPSGVPGNHLQASNASGMHLGGQFHQGSTASNGPRGDESAAQAAQLPFRTALPHQHQQVGLSVPKRPASFTADPAAFKRQRLQEEQRQQGHHALAAPQQRAPLNAQSEAVSSRIDISAGPVFTTPAEFSERQLLDLARALESGVDSNVAHALNALSLASFSAPEALLPAQRQLLPALIGIARSGLPEAFWEAESADLVKEPEEPDFSRPPVAVHRSKWAPKGHWWERAGIFSDQGLEDERLTAALCAGNVLRNLASVKSAEPFQASAAFHELLVAALKARAEEGWPALNELVSSLLDALQPAAAAADLPALGETGAELLAQLGQLALWGASPSRLCALAVFVTVSLAGNGANHGTIAAFTGDSGAGFLDSMAALLLLGQAEAADAARAEAHGCMGPTFELLDPLELSQEDLQQLGLVLKFEVAATVGQALYILLHQPGEGGNVIRRQVGSHPGIAAALRHFLLGVQPPVEVPATARGTRPPMEEAALLLRLPVELQKHATHLRMRAIDSAARCLNVLRQLPEAGAPCQAFEPELALAAMSPGPAADYLAVLVGPPAAPRAAARPLNDHAAEVRTNI